MSTEHRMSTTAPGGRRSGVAARLGVAAVVGALTGGAALLAGHLMPATSVAVACRPAGGVGCAIAAPIGGLILGLLRWLLVVAAVALVAGGLLSWCGARLVGVRLGAVVPLAWPVLLWALATLIRPLGGVVQLRGVLVPGYVALAYVLVAALTAPQVRLAVRVLGTCLIALAVVAVLALR
jgi:hypothetical protein